MFKITITGIDAYLLTDVEEVGRIEHIYDERGVFTASFDGCNVRVGDCCIRIKNLVRHSRVILANCEFEEINIK